METKGFFLGEAVKMGWAMYKKRPVFYPFLFLLLTLISVLPGWFVNWEKAIEMPWRVAFFQVIHWVLMLLVGMATYQIGLIASTGELPRFRDIFRPIPRFFSYLGATILYMIIVFIGLVLLIFPGVIWGLKFGLYPYFVIDKKQGPIQALESSSATTSGAKWDLLGLSFVNSVLTLIGIACLLVGVFVVFPVILIAYAYVYRKLLEQTDLTSG